jgi:homoisocitrate dehydrogenase
MFKVPFRTFSTTARRSLKIGLIPADGIGKEVIPVTLTSSVCFLESHKIFAGCERSYNCVGI